MSIARETYKARGDQKKASYSTAMHVYNIFIGDIINIILCLYSIIDFS